MPNSSESPFPSALQRHHGGEPDINPSRREPSAAEVARMTADEYKRYAQGRGEWVELDRDAVAESRRTGYVPAAFIRESR